LDAKPTEVVEMEEQRDAQVLVDDDIKTEWRRSGTPRSAQALADPDTKDADGQDSDTVDSTDSDTTDPKDSDSTDSDSDSTDS
jgi:hypothetical protein